MGNELDLEAIKQRADAATPGPWEVVGAPFTMGVMPAAEPSEEQPVVWRVASTGFVDEEYEYAKPQELAEADAVFIAHAREDVPRLVAEVEQLRARLATSERFRLEDGCSHGRELIAQSYSVARRCYQSIYRLMTIDDEQKRPLGDAYHQGLADAASVVDIIAKVCKQREDDEREAAPDATGGRAAATLGAGEPEPVERGAAGSNPTEGDSGEMGRCAPPDDRASDDARDRERRVSHGREAKP